MSSTLINYPSFHWRVPRLLCNLHQNQGEHALDKSSHYLELALQYFERSEQANNPQIRGKLRKLAQEYRDRAFEMLDRALSNPKAD